MAVTVLVKIDHEIERLLESRVEEPHLRRWMSGTELPVQVLAALILPDILFVPPDFAVFFDDPRYQTIHRQGSLFDYPERTLSIAYQSYLNANPDPIRRAQEVQDAVQQATLGKAESLAIAELKKRIIDLERANAELATKVPKATEPVALSPSSDQEAAFQPDSKQQSQDQIQEFMKRLEKRVAELEQALKESEPNRK